jgi:GDP-L-fucose synthase
VSPLAGLNVAVTGGAGFLGSAVVRRLHDIGCRHVFVVRSDDYDLRRMRDVLRMFDDAHPEVVLHLAGKVGGVGHMLDWPAEYFYDNLIMGAHVLEAARRLGVRKVVSAASVCCYPQDAPVPLREEDIWAGYPEEAVAPYGLAKRALIVQAQAYRRQYGLNAVTLLPANLYGPGDDREPDTAHLVPALIRNCLDAIERGRDTIELWGSGEASREFLFVEDAAEAFLLAAERYDGPEPVNVGTGHEITIRDIAERIAALTGFGGRIVWDPSQPDGQPRRCLDTSRAREQFGFIARTSFEDGLERTVHWYEYSRDRAPAISLKEPAP